MHAFLANLTAAMLLSHALAGCCWQHVHGCFSCETTAAIVLQSASCCGHDHGSGDEQHPPAAPCKCKLQCRGLCIYLPTQKTLLDAPQFTMPLGYLAALAAPDVASALASCCEGASAPNELEPPLRLHLLHQSLLI